MRRSWDPWDVDALAQNAHTAMVLGPRCPRCFTQSSAPLVPPGFTVSCVRRMKDLNDSLCGGNGSPLKVDLVVEVVGEQEGGGERSIYVFLWGPECTRSPSTRDRIVIRALTDAVGEECVFVCTGIRHNDPMPPLLEVWKQGGYPSTTQLLCDSCAEQESRHVAQQLELERQLGMEMDVRMARRAEAATRWWRDRAESFPII